MDELKENRVLSEENRAVLGKAIGHILVGRNHLRTLLAKLNGYVPPVADPSDQQFIQAAYGHSYDDNLVNPVGGKALMERSEIQEMLKDVERFVKSIGG